MEKIFEYHPDGWSAESDADAGSLALLIHKYASGIGLNANIMNSPMHSYQWDKILQFAGVRIEFKNQDYGCSLDVVIVNDEKIDKAFFILWQFFVDKNIFWGGPYVKDLTAENKDKKPNNQQADMGNAENLETNETQSEKNKINKLHLPVKRRESVKKKGSTYSEDLKDYIIRAYETSGESYEFFVTHSVDFVVNRWLPSDVNFALLLFKKEYKGKEDFVAEDMAIEHYAPSQTLRAWVKKKNEIRE